ncbi:MAG: deoxyribodipyrimidine photo-lyase [Chitinophagales bacterium]|nr:deoxyribodipyrimidine photo-lyase [Bacteroidota bacterium]MCB9044215.1 deoxyribodipyrimidine photo-lyase [Chitinophagales bacterium]
MQNPISIAWFRRDLRIEDHRALFEAQKLGLPILPLFIFDTDILDKLKAEDARITFIHQHLALLHQYFASFGSQMLCLKGTPQAVWQQLCTEFDIAHVFFHQDFEPYALARDQKVSTLLANNNIRVHSFLDHILFAPGQILKDDQTPYTVYTPFRKKWESLFHQNLLSSFPSEKNFDHYVSLPTYNFPSLGDIGFVKSSIEVKPYRLEHLANYAHQRNFPAEDEGSYLSPHLRFGTVSIRKVVQIAQKYPVFLHEIIWRSFFIHILYFFPKVVSHNFKAKYDVLEWRVDEANFAKWCEGKTGYPLVDAGMRQLNATGYMHNRVRMITASFLCKHLLIDWRWGEAYFAEKLLDFELASNNGNWQWVAGTGCDAAPYFRIFNPAEQQKKFDPKAVYIRQWVKEFDDFGYPAPIVEHTFARERALNFYQKINA